MGLRDLLSPREWLIEEPGFSPHKVNFYETIFTVGNGYMGTRGALEEGIRGDYPGTYLAGVYDQHDSAVIDIVNAPNWLPLQIRVDGERLNPQGCRIPEFRRLLDMRRGLLYRYTLFEDTRGRQTGYESLRFASLADRHLCIIRAAVTPINYSGTIQVESLLDGGVRNLDRRPVYVPEKPEFHPEIKWEKWARSKHLEFVEGTVEKEDVYLEMRTMDTNHHLGYAASLHVSAENAVTEYLRDYEKVSQVCRFEVEQGKSYEIDKTAAIHTSRDVPVSEVKASCLKVLRNGLSRGIDAVFDEHTALWDVQWNDSDCVIKGDEKANQAVRFSIYHLLIAGNPEDPKVNIGAKSLSGEGYHGHVFWDTEIYMLPFFIYTQPETARALEMYRYNTMEGALENARQYGQKGSRFAWESADTGLETTPKWTPDQQVRIWTGEEEIQITADVAYGVLTYYAATGDTEFFLDHGVEILLNTARFWESRLEHNRAADRYELNRVIGPDEFHDHVDNNVYTNRMARWNLHKAVETWVRLKEEHPERIAILSERLSITDAEVSAWQEIADRIYIPYDPQKKLIEQFEGYFKLKDIPITGHDENSMPVFPEGYHDHNCGETTLVKQPDVVMLLYVLPDEFDDEVKRVNYEYYEERTMHRSSLSPCIHSIMGIEIGDTTRALQYFFRSALVDLHDNQGNTEYGIHAASAGGTWMSVVFGFGGFRIKNGQMTFKPWLPGSWEELRFRIRWHGDRLDITIRHREGEFTLTSDDTGKTVDILVFNDRHTLESGNTRTVTFPNGQSASR